MLFRFVRFSSGIYIALTEKCINAQSIRHFSLNQKSWHIYKAYSLKSWIINNLWRTVMAQPNSLTPPFLGVYYVVDDYPNLWPWQEGRGLRYYNIFSYSSIERDLWTICCLCINLLCPVKAFHLTVVVFHLNWNIIKAAYAYKSRKYSIPGYKNHFKF